MDEKLTLFKNLGKLMSLSNTEGHAKALGLEAVDVEIGKVVMKPIAKARLQALIDKDLSQLNS
jgi:hypothetical protein